MLCDDTSTPEISTRLHSKQTQEKKTVNKIVTYVNNELFCYFASFVSPPAVKVKAANVSGYLCGIHRFSCLYQTGTIFQAFLILGQKKSHQCNIGHDILV